MSDRVASEEPRAFIYSLEKISESPVELTIRHLPDVDARHIVIKPNWVKHQDSDLFPIDALVTSKDLIDAAIRACLEKYSHARSIVVGDAPLSSCDWEALLKQTRLDTVISRYSSYSRPKIQFLDLRRERFKVVRGIMEKSDGPHPGDPLGYREVHLDQSSYLDPISEQRDQFRFSEYDQHVTVSSHAPGVHRYVLSETILKADLIVNMPKMKTHQKTGITGALKNLVGINGDKANLVHFRRGRLGSGGDEFPPDVPVAVWAQVRIREYLLRRPRLAFDLSRRIWRVLRQTCRIQVEGTPENIGKRFFIAGGSWYGNDTIWRMVYDLNKLILYVPPQAGELANRPQRAYIAILDGIIAGEGNGPLQPLPVNLGTVMFSEDPFIMDMAMSRLMGFDYRKIPLLSNHVSFRDQTWGCFDPEVVSLWMDGAIRHGISSLPTLHPFLPPPGWKDHIELSAC